MPIHNPLSPLQTQTYTPALLLFFPLGVVVSSPVASLPPLILRFPPPGVTVSLRGILRLRMMRKGLGKATITPSSLWAPMTRMGCREGEGGKEGGEDVREVRSKAERRVDKGMKGALICFCQTFASAITKSCESEGWRKGKDKKGMYACWLGLKGGDDVK
jgi:hypothetical protein